jgi:hypothetical protein
MAKSSYYEHFAVTGNAAVLAVIHTVYGAFISYLLYHIFDEFDEVWKKRTIWYKLTDVTLEIMFIAILGYWASELTLYIPALFPTSKAKEIDVDTWVSGIFFVVALFLFLDELTEKLKFLQNDYFEDIFTKLLPQYGSIIDFSLSYEPITEKDKKNAEEAARKTEAK